jgi:2-phosphosulfolactate phosphatase
MGERRVKVDVAFTPAEVKGAAGRRVVVVIDVLRASSTIVEALVNGARSVLPVATVDEAVRKAEELGRDHVVLCGERESVPIRGFHLGNSPQEFTRARVDGRALIMTTTNGTSAVLAAAGASRCYIGSILNVGALARRLAEHEEDVLLLCAGKEGGFAAEDALCAGRITRRLREHGRVVLGNDAAVTAVRLTGQRPLTPRALARTAAGRQLRQIGRADDIVFCAQEDRHDAVPVLENHRLRL